MNNKKITLGFVLAAVSTVLAIVCAFLYKSVGQQAGTTYTLLIVISCRRHISLIDCLKTAYIDTDLHRCGYAEHVDLIRIYIRVLIQYNIFKLQKACCLVICLTSQFLRMESFCIVRLNHHII